MATYWVASKKVNGVACVSEVLGKEFRGGRIEAWSLRPGQETFEPSYNRSRLRATEARRGGSG